MSRVQASRLVPELSDELLSDAIGQAEKAAHRARKRAQIRFGYIRRPAPDLPPPPLARMLRGGHGGMVRIKFFLSCLWMQTKDDGVELAFPAQVWARLFGLEDPETSGARRVNEAQRWLEEHNFITVQAQPGYANKITVLNETGNGERYQPPGAAANRYRETDRNRAAANFYGQIPATFWTNGYCAQLTAAGIAMFLILLDQYGPGGPDNTQTVWFSPKAFRDLYALSDDTRAKGISDLTSLGLVTTTRRVINPHDFDIERIRNTYALHIDTLDTPAKRGAHATTEIAGLT